MFKPLLSQTLVVSLIFSSSHSWSAPRAATAEWWKEITAAMKSQCASLARPIDSGTSAHRPAGPSFLLDEKTQEELKLSDLLFPLVAQHSPAFIGKARLRNMMTDLSLSSSEIRLRQEAVKDLIANETLLADLNAFFKEFAETTKEETLSQFLSGVDKNSELSLWMEAQGIFSGSMGAASTTLIALHADRFQQLGMAALSTLIGTAMIFIGAEKLFTLRNRHNDIRRMIHLAQGLHQRLDSSSSTLLRELGTLFQSFESRQYTSPRNRIVRNYLQVAGTGVFGRILDISYYSSVSLRRMNQRLSRERQQILMLATGLAELSALAAIAKYSKHSEFVFPEILDEGHPPFLSIENGHHPYVFADIKENSIANNIALSAGSEHPPQAIILTGVNGGGKSTYLRMIGSLLILGQLGAAIPARSARWTPFSIISNMSSSDSLVDSESLFRAQVRRVRNIISILQTSESPALLLVDEPFKGTSVDQHQALERALLRWVLKTNTVGVIATHSLDLPQFSEGLPTTANFHFSSAAESFRIQPGPSAEKNARDILIEEGMDPEFVALFDEEFGHAPN